MGVKVSVIIVNYNTFLYTKKCIETVIHFTKGVEYEIILVDNASKECNPKAFTEIFPDIRLIASDQNLGFAGGNNLGIAAAAGEVILLLNSDTELVEDSIASCYTMLMAESHTGVLSCKLIYPDGTLQYASQEFRTIKQEMRAIPVLKKLVSYTSKNTFHLTQSDTAHYSDWVWGTFFMFKREVLKSFPKQKLHETFFMYGEDKQWCYHIGKNGYKVAYKPHTYVIHHSGKSTKNSEAIKFKTYIWPNERKFMAIERGWWYPVVYFLLKALGAWLSKDTETRQMKYYFFKKAFIA